MHGLGGAGVRTSSLMAKAPSTVRVTPAGLELEAVALAAGPQKSVAKMLAAPLVPMPLPPQNTLASLTTVVAKFEGNPPPDSVFHPPRS